MRTHWPVLAAFLIAWLSLVAFLPFAHPGDEARLEQVSAAALVVMVVLGALSLLTRTDRMWPALFLWKALLLWCLINLGSWIVNLILSSVDAPDAFVSVFGIGRLISIGPVAMYAYRAQRHLNDRGWSRWLPPFAALVGVVIFDLRASLGLLLAISIFWRLRALRAAGYA